MNAGTTGPSAAADRQRTLDRVDALVTTTLEALSRDWAALAGDACDVLGSDDLPALARRAARGGKRLRPEMVHWGWVAATTPAAPAPGATTDPGDPAPRATTLDDGVVRLGAALELLHVFALVHDDVMDGSELRRGVASVHARARDAHRDLPGLGSAEPFGEHIAILVGDLVHAEADHLVAPLPAPVRAVWRTMMLELVLGQRLDLTGAAAGRRDLDQARRVARLKSGSYTVQRPLQMGALLGGADEALVGCLLRFGHHAGEAFGLRDDLLGTWGDPGITGKPRHDDLRTGKPTMLLALADEHLDDRHRSLLRQASGQHLDAGPLDELRRALEATGVREQVEDHIDREVRHALAALDPRHVGAPAIAGLTDVVHRIAWRTS